MSNSTPRAGRILLVDDDDALRDALADLLESRGYDVVAVDDGKRGLEQCQRESFDLVVTDFRMPGLGGMELLKELRESNPKMPVIMMTAFSTADSAIEATRVSPGILPPIISTTPNSPTVWANPSTLAVIKPGRASGKITLNS